MRSAQPNHVSLLPAAPDSQASFGFAVLGDVLRF